MLLVGHDKKEFQVGGRIKGRDLTEHGSLEEDGKGDCSTRHKQRKGMRAGGKSNNYTEFGLGSSFKGNGDPSKDIKHGYNVLRSVL